MDIRIDNEFEFRENSSQTEIFSSSHCIDARADAGYTVLWIVNASFAEKLLFLQYVILHSLCLVCRI